MRLGVKFIAVAALAACTAAGSDRDVVGPFTGPTTRFAIDHFTLPTNNATAFELADDLNGDGTVDNQLGSMLGTLFSARWWYQVNCASGACTIERRASARVGSLGFLRFVVI